MDFNFDFDLAEENTQPQCDMGSCGNCGWKGPLSVCEIGKEGDYESGYYDIPLCPICPDGGCIDDYFYSSEQRLELEKWEEANKQ